MNHYSATQLEEYCKSILVAAGVENSCAKAVTESLIDAELTGVSTHGVSRMAIYMERIEKGLVSKENKIRVTKESPSALVIDAGNSLGAPAAKFAMEACIHKAHMTGCCFATVKNSNHFGTAAFYARMAASHDMIGFACTNLRGKIAPFGSSEPFVGTNPVSFAAPSEDIPFVLDMSPSIVALGKLILAQKMGNSIPLGWALDEAGNPTTNPAEGRKGSLLPIGGPKGSGLAMSVDILSGILSGAGYGMHLHDLYEFDEPQGVGHFLGAIDIAHFIDLKLFKSSLKSMMQEIKGLRKADGFGEILIPGERSAKSLEARRKNGIDLPDQVLEELLSLGKPYGLSL